MDDARSIGAAIGEKLRAMQGMPMPMRNDDDMPKPERSHGINVSPVINLPESMKIMMEMAGIQETLMQIVQIISISVQQQNEQNALLQASMDKTNQLISVLSAPKRIVNDKNGNPIGVEVSQ